jgi:hypothetical protein
MAQYKEAKASYSEASSAFQKADANIETINKNMDKAQADKAAATATLSENSAKSAVLDKAIQGRVAKEQRMAAIQGGMHEPHKNPQVFNSAKEFQNQMAYDKRMATVRNMQAGAASYTSGVLSSQEKFREQQKAAARSDIKSAKERSTLDANAANAKQPEQISKWDTVKDVGKTALAVGKAGVKVTAAVGTAAVGAATLMAGGSLNDAKKVWGAAGTAASSAGKDLKKVANDHGIHRESFSREAIKEKKVAAAEAKVEKLGELVNATPSGNTARARNQTGTQGGGNRPTPENTSNNNPTTSNNPKPAPNNNSPKPAPKSETMERFDKNTQKSGKGADKEKAAKKKANENAGKTNSGGNKRSDNTEKSLEKYNRDTGGNKDTKKKASDRYREAKNKGNTNADKVN